VKIGTPGDIVSFYHGAVSTAAIGLAPPAAPRAPDVVHAKFRPDPAFDRRSGLFRHGSGAARIPNVELLEVAGTPLSTIAFGMEVTLRVHVEFYEDVPVSTLGFLVRDKNGVDVVGTNTNEEGRPIPPRRAGTTLVIDFRQSFPLQPGPYSVS